MISSTRTCSSVSAFATGISKPGVFLSSTISAFDAVVPTFAFSISSFASAIRCCVVSGSNFSGEVSSVAAAWSAPAAVAAECALSFFSSSAISLGSSLICLSHAATCSSSFVTLSRTGCVFAISSAEITGRVVCRHDAKILASE